MIKRVVEAIYENGVLRPLEPLGLAEQSRVNVTLDTEVETSPGAAVVRACAGSLPPEDARELREIIAQEFEKVDDREW